MELEDHVHLSRREFVRGAATAGAAVAGLSLARSAHAAGNDALRVGLVGCGSRGIGAAANAMEADAGVRLAALADLFADRAGGRAQPFERPVARAGDRHA